MATKTNIETSIEEQIATLRSELASLTETVSSKAGDWKDQAEDTFDEAKGRVRRVAESVRESGQTALDTVKENPGTATSLFTTAALIGFVAGYFLGVSSGNQSSSSWSKHWR